MRKLIESTFVTLDGVISEPHKWGGPYWDDEHSAYARELLFASEALLLGRETYDVFAPAWSSRDESDEYTARINAMPKYVATRTPRELTWNSTALGGDAAEEVRKLKQAEGGSLLKFGTGSFSSTLLEHQLVDEYHLWYFPVVAGSGGRLLEGHDLTHLHHAGSTTFKSGIVVHKLTLNGSER